LKPITARRPMDWLTGQVTFQDLSLQAGRLAELQTVLDLCAPVKGLKVKTLDQTVLAISAPNASIAAKFRQFEPTVLRTLTERGWKVSRIRVRPQLASDIVTSADKDRAARPTVPASGIAAMEQLLQTGVEGSLETAIAHFIKNRQKKPI
jgi:hypothetical protein